MESERRLLTLENKYCPICGEENKCMAGTQEQWNCWCGKQGTFPKGIFEFVPTESNGKHCICENCVNTFREQSNIEN
ncbi:cysteine-rich CWC family protein [Bacillus sp. FJAT-47783]|uniref:cysteine-rich CWC family protein n=1 Tax=Bacillus sp. FJAT-47783 TaxID=2922712 RepID=UPI002434D949|nr:cysteine-rich CWC family protein [Bacillus sp. FJAT-47783]